ncbi:unnamed protein product [Phaeothamnion confervicola]
MSQGDVNEAEHEARGGRICNTLLLVLAALPALAAWQALQDPGCFGLHLAPDSLPVSALPLVTLPLGATTFCQLGIRQPFVFVNIVMFAQMLLFWLISIAQRSTWLIDPYWTIIPPLIAIFYRTHPLASFDRVRSAISLALLAAWSVRLTHSYFRREAKQQGFAVGKREDWRFADMRRKDPRNFWWTSLFLAYLSQQVMLVGLCLPYLAIHFGGSSKAIPWGAADVTAAAACIVGLALAHFSDTQLHRFVSENARLAAIGQPKVKVLDTGLWRFSRHPNHFGEQAFWWGTAIFGWSSASGSCGGGVWWPFAGTLFNSCVMAHVTRLVEQRMLADSSRAKQFREYCQRTSIWVPWPPRRSSWRDDLQKGKKAS